MIRTSPVALGNLLTGFEVRTAADQGWEELTNGLLMEAAEAAGFALIITADQNIVYQQNMKDRLIGLVVLSTNHWPSIRVNAGRILLAVERIRTTGFEFVNCGLTPKRRHS